MQESYRRHIEHTLGVDILLKENGQISKKTRDLIIESQLIYENFIDTIKSYVGEFKDFAATLYRVINGGISDQFSDSLLRTFKGSDIKKKVDEVLNKIKKPDLLDKILNKIKGISKPIIKLISTVGFVTLAKFFYDRLKSFTEDQIAEYVSEYFSENVLSIFAGFATGGFSKLVEFLRKIGIAAATVYKTLETTINAFKEAFKNYDQGDKWAVKMVKENINSIMEELNEGEFCPQCLAEYIKEHWNLLQEAEYQGRKVPLGKPMAGDVKKFKVYVKNDKGNVVKVNFGQKGVKIKKSNPKRRKSFRARHRCSNPGPRWKARYWSCRKW